MQYRYLGLRYIWYRVKGIYPIWLIMGLGLGWLLFGCAAKYPFTPVPTPQETEFKDPLAVGHRQKESVAGIVGRLGDPEIPFSWAGDDFKFEVLKWKIPNSNLERWAIRINNIYKFTWTQFDVAGEVKK